MLHRIFTATALFALASTAAVADHDTGIAHIELPGLAQETSIELNTDNALNGLQFASASSDVSALIGAFDFARPVAAAAPVAANDIAVELAYAEDCTGKDICHVRVTVTNASDEAFRGQLALNINVADAAFAGYAMPNGFICNTAANGAACTTAKSLKAGKSREFFVRVANEAATAPALCAELNTAATLTKEDIKSIQVALADKGLFAGRANGKFGRTTASAIAAFGADAADISLLNALTGSNEAARADADASNNSACVSAPAVIAA